MNKMLKKLFIPISMLVSTAALLPLSAVSNKTQDKNDEISDQDLRWNNFIHQASINAILDEVYANDIKAKEAYIQSQKELLNTDYNMKVKSALRFANVISRASSASAGDFWWEGSTFPYPVQQADKIIDEARKKNWLWYLFNLNNFTYMQNNVFTRENNQSQADFAQQDATNKLLYSLFISPKSNVFTQYVKQEQQDSDDVFYYLLNQDGFVLKVNVTAEINYETNEVLAKHVEIYSYLKTFPKLLADENKDLIFNLNKYVRLYGEYNIDTSAETKTDEVLYKDYYGGLLLQYSAVDIK
ncbi:aromatic motif membrane protein [Mycoplasma seminis]|uniref:Uncharacterized protein n=1 Tax=Mycoplasma seminis TaxID=512749 RepID=A0ABY9HE21_9MOLU|nr:aromatic motif membrane protein [Mycoplasma seminis]WLP85923.1 hypothetical protein Q8852_02140 [Mycoplasma seminis]